MTAKKLDVYLNKIFVGKLEQSLKGGAISFTYDTKYLNSANPLPLSISLPLQPEPFKANTVKPFFSGLLPEGDQLFLVASALKVSERNPFALLYEIGRDCAGSIEILPETENPPTYFQGSNEALSSENFYDLLSKNNVSPLTIGKKKNRLSLAGAQRKVAVFFDEKKDSLPALVNGKPSTHILKPLMPRHSNSVHNEFFCMKLAKKIGFDVAEVFFKQFKDQPYLLIRRYDRSESKSHVIRIHQEDFCQALGLMPEQKYQGIEGGPGIETCLNLISQHSTLKGLDTVRFIHSVVFNYLIGNSDAHGKNFSLLYESDKTRLAPFYDLISTCCYPEIDHEMAMKIGKSKDPNRTSLNHWHSMVADTNSARSYLNQELKKFATKLPKEALKLQQSLKKIGIESEIFDEIRGIIDKRSKRILGYF